MRNVIRKICFYKLFIVIFCLIYSHYTNLPLKAEVRGVWIPTVRNSSWPKTFDVEEQKKEMIENLDLIKSIGINRVYFQVRPRCDAMYVSEFWPWSSYLTGELGKDPGYDPLLFAKQECGNRNITLEAWINPFLIINGIGEDELKIDDYISKLPDKNPLKNHKEWIVRNGNKYFLNPGEPAVIKMIIEEITYLAQKYKLSIHMDDFFYPYPSKKMIEEEIYDKKEYDLYGKGKGLGDFRRDNINLFIKEAYENIKKVDCNLSFSVSPFAIYKNKIEEGGAGTNGLESYYVIYCDSVLWVKERWVDYIIPQIYWHIGYEIADYKKLTEWWSKIVDGTGVKLLIGQAGYRLDESSTCENFRSSKEIIDQIKLNRKTKNVCGQVIFSINCLKENKVKICDELEKNYKKN